MEKPAEIQFRNFHPSEALEAILGKKINDLEKLYPRLTTCRVVVELPHQRHESGNLFHVVVNLGVPGEELVVDNSQDDNERREDVYMAVNDAFERAKRVLREFSRRQRGQVKRRGEGGKGAVAPMR